VLRFSIVIPNYNSGAILERAIRSLLMQEYPALQLVLADGGSSDESRAIIERHRALFDPLISEPDRGQADGLNKGFAAARGDVFGWLCADDELLPGALHHVDELLRAHPDVDVVVGHCERVWADGTTTTTRADPEAWQKIGVQNVIDQPSVFWRAALHRRLGPLDSGYHLAFDWDYWCRMQRAGARLLTTDRLLSRFHFSIDNKTATAGPRFAAEAFQILRRYGPAGGALAYVYRFLYRHFDLKGCYDQPPTCSRARGAVFVLALAVLKRLVSERLLFMYNWHFASCQQRQLKWW
jgi:glycosyltransferase involved in cell wall biosynthesis